MFSAIVWMIIPFRLGGVSSKTASVVILLQIKPIGVSQIKIISTMKKQYITPALKVVVVRTEHGYNTSAFNRTSTDGLFLQNLIEGEARAEHFNYDDWSSSSPSTDDNRFNYNDWGSL